ncbi:MAG: hypothetical protein A3E78_16110 [Alphaproteobacteria bacterium RIFCSPHIGHO2_12_FULL_63_12]|nr:MAG: hypothetical protein A3E78_16110 [Alphaproteobacteria bacterium RIFCSPHIGHO2_12_FULL_63_12]
MSINRLRSVTKESQRGSSPSPRQDDRSGVCVSSNMIGRSQASIVHGKRVRWRKASVASARTQRD